MPGRELGPLAAEALRQRRRRSLTWSIAGALVTVAVVALLVRAVVGDDEQYNPSGMAPLAVAGPLMFWYGAVVARRGVKALRSPAEVREFRPLTATGRRRREGLGRQPREDVSVAWLTAQVPDGSATALAIPVDPSVVADLGGVTAGVVHGDWLPGGHVVLELPDQVVFPIGPVIEVPADLPRHVAYWRVVGLDEHEPFWNRMQRK